MKRLREFLITYAPKKRYYIAICCFDFILPFIEKASSIYWNTNHYTYEYGLLNPWIRIHNSESMGMKRLAYMLRNTNMGVEWKPQYIFIDAAIIYLVLAIINYIYDRLLRK